MDLDVTWLAQRHEVGKFIILIISIDVMNLDLVP